MTSPIRSLRCFPFVMALPLVACGSSDDTSNGGSGGGAKGTLSATTAQSFEGIYQMREFSENTANCEAEGSSILSEQAETYLVAVASQSFGQQLLQVVSCSDEADCRTKVPAIESGSGYGASLILTFTSETGPSAIGGFEAFTGFEKSGVCEEREYTDLALERDDGAIRIESRSKLLENRPAEDGFCSVSSSEFAAEAESVPCSELRVIHAERVTDL